MNINHRVIFVSVLAQLSVAVSHSGFAADESVPVQPKIVHVLNNMAPGVITFKDSDVTMMTTDPFVEKQVKQTSKLLNKKGNAAVTKANPKTTAPQVEVIKLSVDSAAPTAKNTSDKFIFADITKREAGVNISNKIVLSPETRRLQVEAVRQAAAKKKNR